MTCLIDDNGREMVDFSEINNEVHTFNKNLYSSKGDTIENVDVNDVLEPDTPKLSEEEANSLEGKISANKALNALKNMKSNKSPGSSGFTVEFFKFFWNDLGAFLLKSINEGFDKGDLSITQKEGIITCIPKGDKSKKGGP